MTRKKAETLVYVTGGNFFAVIQSISKVTQDIDEAKGGGVGFTKPDGSLLAVQAKHITAVSELKELA